MSAVISKTDLTICKLVQKNLIDYYRELVNPMYIKGVWDALKSPLNAKAGTKFTQLVEGTPKPGTSPRKVRMEYVAPNCTTFDGSAGSVVNPCSITGTAQTRKFADYEVGLISTAQTLEITVADLKAICKDKSMIMADWMNQAARVILEDINAQLGLKAYNLMSTYTDGDSSITDPQTVNLINSAGVPNFIAMTKLNAMYKKRGYTSPIIVGGPHVEGVISAQGNLGQASNGIDYSKFGANMFSDFQLDGVVDNSETNIITWAPGTFQLIEWYNTQGLGAIKQGSVSIGDLGNTYEQEASVVNINGIDFDFYATWTCNKWVMQLQKIVDIADIPSDAICENKYPALAFISGCGDGACSYLDNL